MRRFLLLPVVQPALGGRLGLLQYRQAGLHLGYFVASGHRIHGTFLNFFGVKVLGGRDAVLIRLGAGVQVVRVAFGILK